jgi:hypothetical protein
VSRGLGPLQRRALEVLLEYGSCAVGAAHRKTPGQSTGSVELGAIPLATLQVLMRGSIEKHMDSERLRTHRLAEEQERSVLRSKLHSVRRGIG